MHTADELLDRHADRLDGFVHHPFFGQAETGRLSIAARDAYFVYEHRFVEQAVVVLGHILTKAPTRTARSHVVSMLHGLVTDQFEIFDAILGQIGRPKIEMPETVTAFCDGMTAIARDGSYAQGLAAMFAAEWTYAEVSKRIDKARIEDKLLRDWFALHCQERFLDGVAWLRQELDSSAGGVTEGLSHAFLRAIDLEIAFHDAPLQADH